MKQINIEKLPRSSALSLTIINNNQGFELSLLKYLKKI